MILNLGKSTRFPIINAENRVVGKIYVVLKKLLRKNLYSQNEERKRRVHTDNSVAFDDRKDEEDEIDISIKFFM